MAACTIASCRRTASCIATRSRSHRVRAALDIREGKRYLTAPSIMVAFCLPPDAAVIPLLIRRHRLYYFLTERCDGLVSPGYLYDFPLAVMYEAPDVIGSR